METRPLHIYKLSKGFDYWLCVLFGIGAIVGSSYFIYFNTVEKAYPQLLEILASGAVAVLGFYCLYYYLNRRSVIVYEDFIILKAGLSSKTVKIKRDDIHSWAELEKTTKHSSWKELYIFTPDEKYSFTSNNYSDYYSLKLQITKKKHHNTAYEKKHDLKSISRFSFFFLILGIGFSILGIYYFATADKAETPKQIVKINQIVTSEIKTKKHGKSSRYILLEFNDFPEFDFNIKGNSYDAMFVDDFVSEITVGDTLTAGILKDDYEKKIAKTKPMDFWDKSINYYDIAVFSVAHQGKDYLIPSDAVLEKKATRKNNAWVFVGIGIFLLAIGLFIFIKRKKIAVA